MRLLDKEFAELFEQFVIEGGGERIFAPRPGVLGVVPVRGSLKPEYVDARAPPRHRRPLPAARALPRHPLRVQAGEGGPARAQLPQADEALRLRRAAAADPARRDRARPGGGVEAPRESSSRSGHVHLAFYGFTMGAESPQFVGTCNCCSLLLRDLPRPEALRRGRRAAEIELPRRHRSREVHCLRGLQQRCPVDAIAEDPRHLASRRSEAGPKQQAFKSVVDRDACIGCGVCVIGCVPDAIGWSRSPRRSGSMFPRTWRSGRRCACSTWRRPRSQHEGDHGRAGEAGRPASRTSPSPTPARARCSSRPSPSASAGRTSRSRRASTAGLRRARRASCSATSRSGACSIPGPSGGLKKGDLVVGIVRRPDPVPCPNCAVGEWDMCRNGRYTERGIKEIHGFMSERWRIEPEYAIKVDPSLGILGVLLEPMTVIAKALEQVVFGRPALLLGGEDGARDRRGPDRPAGRLRSEPAREGGPCPRPRRDRA